MHEGVREGVHEDVREDERDGVREGVREDVHEGMREECGNVREAVQQRRGTEGERAVVRRGERKWRSGLADGGGSGGYGLFGTGRASPRGASCVLGG